jgi:hypothetical protein
MSKEEDQLKGKTCDRCGRPAALAVGGEFFCEECYQLPGSCCPEFGGDDIWEFDETDANKKKETGMPPADGGGPKEE